MRLGISGHQHLENSRDWEWVSCELHDLLVKLSKPLTGITCLAPGADSLFARLLLEHDRPFEVVLPFPGYEQKLPNDKRDDYQRLLKQASLVITLQRQKTDEESYLEAGKRVVDLSDLLIAVWDGKPAKGLGGTADVVKYARRKHEPIIHLDPIQHMVDGSPPFDRLTVPESKQSSPP
jgi:hypothetical protein